MDVKQERKRNTIIGLVLAVGSFAIIQGLIMAGVIRSYQMVTVATICINIILAAGLNLVTGFTSGYYLYFRSVYNDWQLGRSNLSQPQRAANFFFIRENCYGSMFRYNAKGEFNIPYGGMSYNDKDFAGKIRAMFNDEMKALFSGTQLYCRDFEEFLRIVQPTEQDFIFLDPPYDTEFSDYEGAAFTRLDHARLALALSQTKAKFLLIIKDTPYISGLYSQGFHVTSFDKQYAYNVRSRNDRAAQHLIITNYDPMA